MHFYRLLRHTHSSVKHNITIRHCFHQQQAHWISKITTQAKPKQESGSSAQNLQKIQESAQTQESVQKQTKINNTL